MPHDEKLAQFAHLSMAVAEMAHEILSARGSDAPEVLDLAKQAAEIAEKLYAVLRAASENDGSCDDR